jgi:hypothetical protein
MQNNALYSFSHFLILITLVPTLDPVVLSREAQALLRSPAGQLDGRDYRLSEEVSQRTKDIIQTAVDNLCHNLSTPALTTAALELLVHLCGACATIEVNPVTPPWRPLLPELDGNGMSALASRHSQPYGRMLAGMYQIPLPELEPELK